MVLNNEKLKQIIESFSNLKIAIIGDLMLDCYIQGTVKRISPEAPVPVVNVKKEFYRFGGAANVAYNIQKLGATPLLMGVIGNDNYGATFKSLLEQSGMKSEFIYNDPKRPTTSKIRVIAHTQQLVRIDNEVVDEINKTAEEYIIKALLDNIKYIDAIILEDYNKGVLTKNLIKEIIGIANQYNKIVTVDPKFKNFFEYQNVTLMKPNKKETEDALGISIEDDNDLIKAGTELLEKLKAKYVLITLSEQGAAIFDSENKFSKIPTKARKVADVSGAGDTVISALTASLAAGANIYEATFLGNLAGGIVCEQVGVVPIEKDILLKEITNDKMEIKIL
jgi:rfaE bifunctional protein kinase chain/domain